MIIDMENKIFRILLFSEMFFFCAKMHFPQKFCILHSCNLKLDAWINSSSQGISPIEALVKNFVNRQFWNCSCNWGKNLKKFAWQKELEALPKFTLYGQFWHKRAAFQRSAFGRSTAGNDVVATIIISLFFFFSCEAAALHSIIWLTDWLTHSPLRHLTNY